MFDPKTDKFPYTAKTNGHYLKIKKDCGIVFDADYPYIDSSKGFRFVDFLMRVLLRCAVLPATVVRLGLMTKGRENVKKLRNNAVVSCCNHVHMWDYLAILNAIRPRKSRILTWKDNINGEMGSLIRHVGGIPIPEGSVSATRVYTRAINGLLANNGWLHVYAEGSMWEYYAPIRPFSSGAAYFSCKNNVPLLPMAFSYRKPGWIRKKIFGQAARFTLNIGTPLYRDENLPFKEQVDDLVIRSHAAVCVLAGINPDENIYPPVFTDNDRIDYYTDTYGVGYKGSW